MANEIRSLSKESIEAGFKSENLTGYHIGLVYQSYLSKEKKGGAWEIGALLSQKGSFFSQEDNKLETVIKAYNELNYLEMPLNYRHTLSIGIIGIYGCAGLYAGYLFEGKTVSEAKKEVEYMSFTDFTDRLDYGYSWGFGVELMNKLQIGATWSRGIKSNNEKATAKNSLFSVGLVYLF